MTIPCELPKDAARRLAAGAIRDGFIPEALHTYTDANGHPLYHRIRAKNPATGEKWIRPMKLNGEGYTLGEPEFPQGKLVYRLHDLAKRSNETVIVCEGEWCADALAKAGALATTSGGADSCNKMNWEPLAGRDVIIWPDNDEAGQRYAADVQCKLNTLSCTVRLIDVRSLNLPAKADAVDWLAANPTATKAELLALPCITARSATASSEGEIWPEPAPSVGTRDGATV